MKTKPMAHQTVGAKRLAAAPEYFALGAEQGTGKTWMLLNDAEFQFVNGRIDALLVIAPKGVHTNWVTREVPKHLGVENKAEFWLSGAGKRHEKRLSLLLRQERGAQLVILAMNVDAINTTKGYSFARNFMTRYRTMMVIDESQRIKNPNSSRTKKIISLAPLAVSRRIASGTLIANNPLDLFAQYQFLRNGLLGTRSFRAFTAQFAELFPPENHIVQEIQRRTGGSPQIICRDKHGNGIFKNLEQLQNLIAPHTYRVLKKDCLDLPEKIYQTHFFELTPAQRKLYECVKNELRYKREDGSIDIYAALTAVNKLRQVTSGFIIAGGTAERLPEQHPRLSALKELLDDIDGQAIIWASFREELSQIHEMLKVHGAVQYHGGVNSADREQAIEAFQGGDARFFIANPAAGGTGITLTAAKTVVYYSNSFSLEERLQSEDRSHRIGTRHPVVYIDLVARDTIDERIASALQSKRLVASEVLDGF